MAETTPAALTAARLRNQQLTQPSRHDPAQVVSWLGAMQAQEFPGAAWSIGLRAPGCDNDSVERAFNDGVILRTHVLRPTWHFVVPTDIRWLLELSAPRVHAANAYYYKQSGLDAKALARTATVIHRELEGRAFKTRTEIALALNRAKVPADGLKLAYIMMHAELEGLITSGPRRGKQFTYALLDERAAPAQRRHRDDALAELVRRYFMSHGPATINDFVWWSGMTVKDAKAGVAAVASELRHDTIDGRVYWGPAAALERPAKGVAAMLLSTYDEYVIAYKDRSHLLDSSRAANAVARSGGGFPHHLVLGGKLAGSWTRELRGSAVAIQVAPYYELTPAQVRAVTAAADAYGEFYGVPAALSIV